MALRHHPSRWGDANPAPQRDVLGSGRIPFNAVPEPDGRCRDREELARNTPPRSRRTRTGIISVDVPSLAERDSGSTNSAEGCAMKRLTLIAATAAFAWR